MTYQEKPADNSTNVYFGIEWNESNAGATFSIAPKIYRWDRQSTVNNGAQWKEDLTEPSGSTGSWGWYTFSSTAASGYRVIDTFSTRTYSKTHSSQTITYHLYTDANFGTYYNGFTTLGAQTWTFTMAIPAKASYAVSYNANGGSGAPSSQTKWYGEGLTLSSTKPTRTNYVFKNWNTKSDGSGTSYASGASYTGNAALALYAQWYAPYTVSYNANGGSGAPSSQTKVYNTALTLSSTKPTRTGYTFKGWATSSANASAGTVAYAAGAKYAANANATLYAVWQINAWTVSYDGNGATGGSTASQTKTYGQSLALRSNGFTKTNYNFSKWNTAANGSGTSYNAGASYTGNAALKLYAQWTLAHASPTISSLVAKRVDADGNEDPEGTRVLVTGSWETDGNVSSVAVKVGSNSAESVTASGTSGSVSLVSANSVALTSTYTVTMTVTDAAGYSTSRSTTLSVAFFTLHFKAGGKGVGIGKPSTEDNLLDIAMETRFNALATAQGTTSSSVAYGSTNPRFRFSNANASQNGELVFTDYDAIHTGATLAWITDQPQSWFHTQHIKMTGNADVDGTVAKRWAAMNYSTAPSSTIYAQPTTVYDNAGNVIGHDEYAQTTAKSIQHNFAAVRQYNGSAWAWYQCSMTVSSSGAVTYSIHTPAAFRNAIGASSGTWPVSIGGTGKTSGTFYGATRIYSSTATCATFTLTSSVANYTWLTIQYRGNDGFYTTTTVFNNKAALNVALFVIESTANASVNIKRVTYTFSGTSATVKTYGEMDGPNSATASKNVTVTGVWGWV